MIEEKVAKTLKFIETEIEWCIETIKDKSKSERIKIEAFGEMRALDKIKFRLLK